ncbi:hypothetical protein BGZ54_005624, partial [Gamsiella multidivaricata]
GPSAHSDCLTRILNSDSDANFIVHNKDPPAEQHNVSIRSPTLSHRILSAPSILDSLHPRPLTSTPVTVTDTDTTDTRQESGSGLDRLISGSAPYTSSIPLFSPSTETPRACSPVRSLVMAENTILSLCVPCPTPAQAGPVDETLTNTFRQLCAETSRSHHCQVILDISPHTTQAKKRLSIENHQSVYNIAISGPYQNVMAARGALLRNSPLK